MNVRVLVSYPAAQLAYFVFSISSRAVLTMAFILTVSTDHNPSFFFRLGWYDDRKKAKKKRKTKAKTTKITKISGAAEGPP